MEVAVHCSTVDCVPVLTYLRMTLDAFRVQSDVLVLFPLIFRNYKLTQIVIFLCELVQHQTLVDVESIQSVAKIIRHHRKKLRVVGTIDSWAVCGPVRT